VAAQIRADHGDPTVLVNNAGVGHDGTILEEPEAKIRQTFEVNIMSHFWMVREFLPSMVKNNHGHVITVASMASFVALGEMADYCASKAGALAFHESLTQELRLWYNAPKVRTRYVSWRLAYNGRNEANMSDSVIHPLWVRTPMIQQLTDAGKHFKQPVLTPQKVSAGVVKQILTQSSGQVILPEYYHAASLVRAFPTWIQEHVRKVASMDLRRLRECQKAQ
jgi:short-subunit dehydrogenase